jgi:hypothetical protein
MPPRAKEIRKKTFLIGKSRLNCGVYFQMRKPEIQTYVIFIYEEDIKIKNKYFAAI